jgi:hypothetical protein
MFEMTLAGLLAYSLLNTFPFRIEELEQWFEDSSVNRQTGTVRRFCEITATGIAPDFHRLPSSSQPGNARSGTKISTNVKVEMEYADKIFRP